MKKLFLLAIVVLGFTVVSFGQNIDNTAKAKVEMVAALNVSHNAGKELDFGKVVPSTSGLLTDITVLGNLAATISESGPGGAMSVSAGSSAAFTITGSPLTDYKVILPANGTISVINGTKSMLVKDFSCDVTAAGTSVTGTVALGKLGTGPRTFYVGATLVVGDADANPTGQYISAGFPVQIAFQ